MQDIDSLRQELDEVQGQLFTLLRRRFQIAEKIWKIKIQQGLPKTDVHRENELVHRFDAELSQEAERSAVQNIIKAVIAETKQYLEVKLK